MDAVSEWPTGAVVIRRKSDGVFVADLVDQGRVRKIITTKHVERALRVNECTAAKLCDGEAFGAIYRTGAFPGPDYERVFLRAEAKRDSKFAHGVHG